MAVTYVSQTNAAEITRMASGNFTVTDASLVTITLGYRPRMVVLTEETVPARYVWTDSLASPTTTILKEVAAGTTTLDTTQVFTATATGFTFVPVAGTDTYSWVSFG